IMAFRTGSANIRSTSASAFDRASRAAARNRVSLAVSAVFGSTYELSNAVTYTDCASNIAARAARTLEPAHVGQAAYTTTAMHPPAMVSIARSVTAAISPTP